MNTTTTRPTTLRPVKTRRLGAHWTETAAYKVYDANSLRWIGYVTADQTSTTALIWTARTPGGKALGQHETRKAAVAQVAAR